MRNSRRNIEFYSRIQAAAQDKDILRVPEGTRPSAEGGNERQRKDRRGGRRVSVGHAAQADGFALFLPSPGIASKLSCWRLRVADKCPAKSNRFLIWLNVIGLAVLLNWGCIRDSEPSTAEGRTVKMKIVLDVPANRLPSRSGQTLAESAIVEAEVLIFYDGSFRYRVPVSQVVNNPNFTTTFTVELETTTAAVTMWVIANGEDYIAAYEPNLGETLFVYGARLRAPVGPQGITDDLTMWGSYLFPGGISDDELILTIPMLRAVARVDVITENVAADFTLATIQAFRAANWMHLIRNFEVDAPSIPSSTLYNVNTDPIAVGGPNSVAQLYVPESATANPANQVSGATCVVIGGYFGGSDVLSYYRLDFNPIPDNSLFGQILRNRRYVFTIESITGPGFATPQQAATSPAVITASTVFWNETIKYTMYDAANYLGVSENAMGLTGNAGATFALDVETNFAGYLLHWADAGGVPLPGAGATSLNDGDLRIQKSPGGSQITVTALTSASSERLKYVVISAGALTMLLTIIQSPI